MDKVDFSNLVDEELEEYLQEVARIASKVMNFKYKKPNVKDINSGLLGCWVVIRTKNAGVHFGKVEAYNNSNVVLSESRRLHYFVILGNSDSISGLVKNGCNMSDSKFNDKLEAIQLPYIEIVPCTEGAAASIMLQRDFQVK